ncbi:hypothetical protein FRC17_010313 [Serendipita sp. 399]|nr:hypothetical protein FRC17_010313 [Serendipita sp. 399]
MSSSTDFRRRTLEAASPASDSLKEWSEKIKSLQQQVDEDGLQEQQRLEAEIQRSRMERAQRRSALGTPRMASAVSSTSLVASPTDGPTRSVQEERDDTLNRLMGSDKHTQSANPLEISSSSNHNSVSTKPISLAEFMGGRATGPRLNKHAPQLDYQEHAEDYQERRTAGSTPLLQKIGASAPVALHGMAKEPKAPESRRRSSAEPSIRTPDIGIGTNKSSSVGATPSTVINNRATPSPGPAPSSPSPQPKIEPSTTTTPPRSLVSSSSSATPSSSVEQVNNASSKSTPSSQPATPVSARWIAATNVVSKSPTPSSPPTTGSQPRVSSLSRPIQPSSPSPPQFIPPTNPSPAFLKPSPKEERPSITRLQGRGFVQKQVKASERLSSTPEESSRTPPPKKVSVLERWPGEGGKKQETPSPSIDAPKREFTRSMPSSSIRPSEVAASISPTNGDDLIPKRQNIELDKAPMRLPGMATANSVPIKSRTVPTGASNNSDSTQAYAKEAPRRLPGLATQPTTPSALRKSSSSSQLREPTRQRSVHFDDADSSLDTPTRIFDGNQTDGAIGGKLTHLTKDRARKPRRAPGIQSTSRLSEVSTPRESEAVHSGDQPGESPQVINEAPSDSETKKEDKEASNTVMAQVNLPAAPAPTIASRRKEEDKTRAKQLPPLVAPKPVALRRNSQPSPSDIQQTPTSNSNSARALVLPTSEKDARATASPPNPTDIESPRVSVKAAISAWGQQNQQIKTPVQAKPPPNDSIKDTTHTPEGTSTVARASTPEQSEPPIVVPPVLNPPTIPMPQPRQRPVSQHSDRRRSITDRYSAIMMPALKEEKTPVATPEGSLKIQPKADKSAVPSAQEIQHSLSLVLDEEPKSGHEPRLSLPRADSLDAKDSSPDRRSPVSPLDGKVVFDHDDQPVPSFNLSRLLSSVPAVPKIAAGNIISVEAYTISGSSSTAIKENMSIFYESDIIAVVYRGKIKTSGLVATTVWAWIGKDVVLTEKEDAKLTEIVTRFNTSLVKVYQGKEPYDLVQVLGGTVAIRHGSRLHWSPENTALHCVRSYGNHFIVIDEVELLSRNVCSGFSYCLSVLDTVVVWHGRGSLPAEREAALSYAKSLAVESVTPTEVEEGTGDETFWMMLDDEVYANADYWRFKPQMQVTAPRLWRISSGALQPVVPFSAFDVAEDGVYMYDGVFELFVIVGRGARGERGDIRLALSAAESLANASAVTRSFPPPVHVLILPTRIPLDLRANFRCMDHREAAGPEYPDHINLLTISEAQQQASVSQSTA